MNHWPFCVPAALFVALALPSPGRADTVIVSGGGQVDGVVREDLARGESVVVVDVDGEIFVKLPKSRVRQTLPSDELAEYRRRAAIAGNDPELNYELARWCKQARLQPQYKYHLQRTIAVEPDHAKARAALRYVKQKGQWRLFSDVKRSEGMISVAGKWVLPEAEAMERQAKAAEVTSKQWASEIDRLRKMVERGNSEGWQALEAIDDPLAAWGIARELQQSRDGSQPRQLRSLWVRLLGRFKTSTSVEALVLTLLEEDDPVVRDLAIDQLHQYGQGSAVATLVPMLRSNSASEVSAAAAALTEFDADPELAMTFVDALVTEHKKVIAPGAGTQAGFSNTGGNSFSTGGKAKVVKVPRNNPDVRALLKEIAAGVDYGYDKDQWRAHFAAQRDAYSGDLRRDR